MSLKKDGINSCLQCGNSKSRLKRGHCETHYSRYWRALQQVDPSDRDAFRDRLIEAGALLEEIAVKYNGKKRRAG